MAAIAAGACARRLEWQAARRDRTADRDRAIARLDGAGNDQATIGQLFGLSQQAVSLALFHFR